LDQSRPTLSEREARQVRALQRRKKRQEEQRFLAEGIRVVEDLLASGLQTDWILAASSLEDSPRGVELLAAADRKGIPIRRVAEDEFVRLAATEHPQGVLAVARIERGTFEAIENARGDSVVLLLDAIQDPGNFGTLTRTAEALGATAVIALPGTVDPWNPKSVRAAAGSLFRVPILTCEWEEAARRLRAARYRLLAAEAGAEPPRPNDRRVGLVLGNEGAGISPEVRATVDGTVGIPLRGRAESLNVAAAAAILLYELTR